MICNNQHLWESNTLAQIKLHTSSSNGSNNLNPHSQQHLNSNQGSSTNNLNSNQPKAAALKQQQSLQRTQDQIVLRTVSDPSTSNSGCHSPLMMP